MSGLWKFFLKHWGILISVVLGVLGIAVAIYIFFYQENHKKTDLSLNILNVEDIYKLNDDLENFDVIYNQQSLKDSEKNIKILSIQLANKGATIFNNYYENEIPFSIIVKNADIIKYEVTNTSDDGYLKDIVIKTESDSIGSSIVLRKKIFDENSYVTFKLYIFCDNDWLFSNMEVNAKIAGQKSIPIISVDYEKKSRDDYFGLILSIISVLLSFLAFSMAIMEFKDIFKKKKDEQMI